MSAIAQAVPVSKLAAEWLVPSSTSPKKFALVDAATGTVRTSFFSSEGTVTWEHTISTGITNVSDVAGGIPANLGEAIAVVSPDANRVMLVDVDAFSPLARTMPSLAGVGPCGVTAVSLSGAEKCMIVSSQNGGSLPGRAEVHADIPMSGWLVAQSNHASPFRRLQPLADPASSGDTVAFYTADAGTGTTAGLLLEDGSSVTIHPKAAYAVPMEFIPGVHDVNGSSGLSLILGYRAGATNAAILKVNTPITTSSFTNTLLSYPFPVSGIVPVTDGGIGPLSDGFLAIAADGTEARWIRIDAAGNAFVSTTETFSPSAGLVLTGLIPMPGIGLMKLEGPVAGGASTSFKAYQWNGSSWLQTDSGSLPALPSNGQSFASLLFYDQDPSANEAASLLGIQSVPDWTRPYFYPDPFPSSVYQETFVSSVDGLTFSSTHAVMPPPGTTYVITNQVEAALSVTALGSAGDLFSPDLRIEPASGSFTESFQITALFDDERYDLYWRDQNGGSWQAWTGPLAVAYSRSLQFSLATSLTGVMGPIERRSYTFSAIDTADQDSDQDGVPDYVELHLGLDPFGGADHDGDGSSDLDEILNGADPNDSGDYPAPDVSANVAVNGGFRIALVAKTQSGQEIRTGEEMFARDLSGSLLDRDAVGAFGVTLPDGSTRGALLETDTPVPANELVALSSPLYFDITTSARSGRELRGFVVSPEPVEFDPVFTPTGGNLAADASGWIMAAQTAASALPIAQGRVTLAPVDTAIAVLLEDLVHRALVEARPSSNPAPALDGFTLFSDREGDRTRTSISPDDFDLLRARGFDFRLAFTLATTARGGMQISSNSLYARHSTSSGAEPGMLMPLDAIRVMFRGGAAPDGYAGATSSTHLNNARTAYNAALAAASQSFRPIETWTIEVQEDPPARGVYQRATDDASVVLLDASGERFVLEQGLGLQAGTRFEITGFTDTPHDGVYDTIEVTSASMTFAPASSDSDTDGNLLDDEWERFFFGAIGQDPFSKPGSGDHSLLLYFLAGLDPRGGDVPAIGAVSLSPQRPVFSPRAGGGYTLDFEFPSAYQDRFEFVLEKSTTLESGSFVEIPDASVTSQGGDQLRATVLETSVATPNGFFRVRVRLR